MAYPRHRPDLIRIYRNADGTLTLRRYVNGLEWTRKVRSNDFLTAIEAGIVLGVHRVTVHNWIGTGVIPATQAEYGALIRWRDLRKFGKANGYLY